jgi:predicted N-acetyltransferase YhbS
MIIAVPLHIIDKSAIEALLDAAFGADRHNRAAYKLRKDMQAIDALSFAVLDDDQLIGSIQCWPVRIKAYLQPDAELVMVGPVAVAPDRQNTGIGKRLMAAALDAAGQNGQPALMMIGDPEYYGQFGFFAAGTAGWQLPGPWDAHRLLLRNIGNHSLSKTGMLEPNYQYAL